MVYFVFNSQKPQNHLHIDMDIFWSLLRTIPTSRFVILLLKVILNLALPVVTWYFTSIIGFLLLYPTYHDNPKKLLCLLEPQTIGEADPSLNGQEFLFFTEKGFFRYFMIFLFLYSFNLGVIYLDTILWHLPSYFYVLIFFYESTRNYIGFP